MSVFRLVVLAVLAVACGDHASRDEARQRGEAVEIVELFGAGATLPYPLYSRWIAEYQRLHPRVWIDYQAIGSGAGIAELLAGRVDFGATDFPLSDEELARAPAPILHIPTAVAAIVVCYNLPGAPGLRLGPDVLAGIYLGTIRRWRDPAIVALNPSAALPDAPISIVHRSDSSGTTAVFTSYLSAVSPRWRERVGTAKIVAFPVGVGARGNEGVAALVKLTPAAIGYTELSYAEHARLPHAMLRNRAGAMVAPSLASVNAAAASVVPPADLRMSIVDAPGALSYPLATFTYLLVYEQQADPTQGRALVEFLWWLSHDGQQFAPPLGFARLPAVVVGMIEAHLAELKTGMAARGRAIRRTAW